MLLRSGASGYCTFQEQLPITVCLWRLEIVSYLFQWRNDSHKTSQSRLGVWSLTVWSECYKISCVSQYPSDTTVTTHITLGFPGGSAGKESAHSAGDLGSIPGSGRSPGEGNGNPLQNAGLDNPMDWSQRIGHDWVAFTFTFKDIT